MHLHTGTAVVPPHKAGNMIAAGARTLLLIELLLVSTVAAIGLPAGADGLSLSAPSPSAPRTGGAAASQITTAVAAAAVAGGSGEDCSGDAVQQQQQQQQSPARNDDDKLAEQTTQDTEMVLPVADGFSLSQGCTFFLVRHGQSRPNIEGKIVSGMEGGVDPANGLTELGREQARKAGKELKEVLLGAGCSPANTIVLTSPFSRAKETAEEIQECLGCELREERDLRERFFGDLDRRDDAPSYEKVWALDALSARHGELGVEPADHVAARAAEVVRRVRKEVSVRQRFYSGDEGQPFPLGPSAVILVSHGDALQMLQCKLAGRPVEQHRSLPHLENCGIRVLRPPPDEAAVAAAAVEAGGAGNGGQEDGDGEEERGDGDGAIARRNEESSGGGTAGAFRLTGARVFRAPGRVGGGREKDVDDESGGDGDGNGNGNGDGQG